MNTFFDTQERTLCCGCGCCEHICPVKAIKMTEDEEGFEYPHINRDLCIDCGLCKSTCPLAKERPTHVSEKYPKVYAIKNKNKEVLKSSSSGGAFSLLADYVLKNNGFVVGCAFDDDLNPNHIIVDNHEDLKQLHGSKYVQSNLGEVYPKIKKLLDTGSIILFTGTPCQVAGLKAFLYVEYENLITADLVCHGVPSNWLFQKYINYLVHKKHGKVVSYRFRDKSKNGWNTDGSYIIQKENKSYKKQLYPERDYYYYLFGISNSIFRESCYACKYTSIKREGDFTMADYWGINELHPKFYSKEGVSLFMLNTEKAEKIFKTISVNADYIPSTIENARKALSNLRRPTLRPPIRNTIYLDINKLGFEKGAKKYCRLQYVRPIIRRAIPSSIKQKMKKVYNMMKNR